MRWSIGPALDAGFGVLKYSIKNAKNIYPDFDHVICHNQLDDNKKKLLSGLGVRLIDTTNLKSSLCIPPDSGYFVYWKLYPPRLRLNSHEIWIDNDIIIEDRLPEINSFLNNKRSVLLYQGRKSLHGAFNEDIPDGISINSGIFGIPPGMNFQKRLNDNIQRKGMNKWNNKFDEQGLVAKTLLEENEIYIIPLTSIPLAHSESSIEPFLKQPMRKGFHFVGVNYFGIHKGWNEYIQMHIKT